jgi:hypothetical protein
MLIFDKDLNNKYDWLQIYELLCNFSNKISKNYIYHLLANTSNKIILYSINNLDNFDLENCPCGLIYNYNKVTDNEINVCIMMISTKYKCRKYGYASTFILEFINFIQNRLQHFKTVNILLDSLEPAVTFYEHIGFKWIISNKEINKLFSITEEQEQYLDEHFIMKYTLSNET